MSEWHHCLNCFFSYLDVVAFKGVASKNRVIVEPLLSSYPFNTTAVRLFISMSNEKKLTTR